MERILHRAELISPPRNKTKNSTTSSSNEETSFSTPTRPRSNSQSSVSPVQHSAERRSSASSQSSSVHLSAERNTSASSQRSSVNLSAERRSSASSQSSPAQHSAERRSAVPQRNVINPFLADDDYELNAQVIARRSQCQRISEQHLFLDAFALTKIKQ